MPFFSARPSFLLLRPKMTGMPCTRQLSMATFTWSMFGHTMQHSSLFFRESRLTSRRPMTRRRRRLAFAGSFAYSLRWNSCSFCKNGTIFFVEFGIQTLVDIVPHAVLVRDLWRERELA